MKLKLLTRSQINVTYWDILIRESQYSIFYAYHWYLDAVTEEWQALVLEGNAAYLIVMPLPIKRKFGLVSVEQPHFCPYLGMFSRAEITPEDAKLFLNTLNQCFNYISCYYFKYQESQLLYSVIQNTQILACAWYCTHSISLDRSYPDIYASYFSDRRANIRKAQQESFKIVADSDLEPLISLFKINHADSINGGVSEASYLKLRNVFHTLVANVSVELTYVKMDGRVIAGALFVESGAYACYFFNASDTWGRITNARAYLVDQFIKKNAGKSMIFDFESPIEESVANYYRRFGAVQQNFLGIKKNELVFPLKQLQSLRKRFFRVKKLVLKKF